MRQGAYIISDLKQKIRNLLSKYGDVLRANFKFQITVRNYVLAVAKYDSKSNFLYKLQRCCISGIIVPSSVALSKITQRSSQWLFEFPSLRNRCNRARSKLAASRGMDKVRRKRKRDIGFRPAFETTVCMCVCMYVYTYVYIYIYIYVETKRSLD